MSNATLNSDTGEGSFDVTFSDGPVTSIVSVQVQDSDGAVSNVSSIDVAVANVAPAVTLIGEAADEGQTWQYMFTTSDPGADTFSVAGAHRRSGRHDLECGVRRRDRVGQLRRHVPGRSEHDRRERASPGFGRCRQQCLVDRRGGGQRGPGGDADPRDAADEGQTWQYTFTTSDPGADTFSVAAAPTAAPDAAISNVTFDAATGSGSFDVTFLDGPNTTAVSVQVQDSDDAVSNVSSIDVAVDNVAPAVTLIGADAADEGQTWHYTFTTSDPGADTFSVAAPTAAPDAAISNVTFDAATGSGSFDVTFLDGPNATIVSVQVEDSDGAVSNVSSIDLAVDNVAPAVTLSGADAADEGRTWHYTFTTSDPGADTFSVAARPPLQMPRSRT